MEDCDGEKSLEAHAEVKIANANHFPLWGENITDSKKYLPRFSPEEEIDDFRNVWPLFA